jgi:hypothetical protein
MCANYIIRRALWSVTYSVWLRPLGRARFSVKQSHDILFSWQVS